MTHTLFAYFQLIRAANIFTVFSNILAASIIAFDGELRWQILPLLLTSICLYHAGMALNDCVDIEEDKVDNPKRPLPAEKIKLTHAWLLVLVLFIIAMISAAFLPLQTFLIAILLAATIIIYDTTIKKGIPGSMVMGSCRYLNWLLPLSLTSLSLQTFALPIPVLLYVTGLTILSKEEHSGTNKTALLLCSTLVVATLAIICAYSFYSNALVWLVVPIVILFSTWIAIKIFDCLRSFTAENIQKLMKALILGIIPIDALMLASHGYLFASLIVICFLPISLQVAKKIYVT